MLLQFSDKILKFSWNLCTIFGNGSDGVSELLVIWPRGNESISDIDDGIELRDDCVDRSSEDLFLRVRGVLGLLVSFGEKVF